MALVLGGVKTSLTLASLALVVMTLMDCLISSSGLKRVFSSCFWSCLRAEAT